MVTETSITKFESLISSKGSKFVEPELTMLR